MKTYRNKQKTILLTTASALFLSPLALAQQGITGVTTVNESATSSSFNDGTYDLNFGDGSVGNERLTGVSVGSINYDVATNIPTEIRIRRNPTDSIPGERQIIWYRQESSSGSTRNHSASQILDMETALSQSIINRGTDNVFTNTGNNDGNNNNIERLDFLFGENYLRPQSQAQLQGVGFSVLERGGNDQFMIAAVTSVDAFGNPTAYAPTVTIALSDWGDTIWSGATNVLQSNSTGMDSYAVTATVGSQNVQGIFFSLLDLGININELVMGYSLFAADTSGLYGGDTSNLLDWTDTEYFPTTTIDSPSETGGGLDLVSGGAGLIDIDLDTTGLFVPIPEPTVPLIAAISVLFGSLLRRRQK